MKIWGNAGAKGKRSLASKYLHFHRPDVFPLFDSQAAKGIGRVTPRKRISKLAAKDADAKYKAFCERYLWFLETIRKRFGRRLSPRHADTLLLAVADRPRRRHLPPRRRRVHLPAPPSSRVVNEIPSYAPLLASWFNEST
jgi:hypothetical protein